jgi:hypothetical protein
MFIDPLPSFVLLNEFCRKFARGQNVEDIFLLQSLESKLQMLGADWQLSSHQHKADGTENNILSAHEKENVSLHTPLASLHDVHGEIFMLI